MNRSSAFVLAAITSLSFLGASAFAADEPSKPPMHMHKSEMNHDKPNKGKRSINPILSLMAM